MIDYGLIHSLEEPKLIEITPTSVLIASDVEAYQGEIDGHQVSGYKYNYKSYTKDEYLLQQSSSIAALQEELSAAKILLGVE